MTKEICLFIPIDVSQIDLLDAFAICYEQFYNFPLHFVEFET